MTILTSIEKSLFYELTDGQTCCKYRKASLIRINKAIRLNSFLLNDSNICQAIHEYRNIYNLNIKPSLKLYSKMFAIYRSLDKA